MHNCSITDFSGDWSKSVYLSRSCINVARPCFLLKEDPLSWKLGSTRLSAVVQWLSCSGMLSDSDRRAVFSNRCVGDILVCREGSPGVLREISEKDYLGQGYPKYGLRSSLQFESI